MRDVQRVCLHGDLDYESEAETGSLLAEAIVGEADEIVADCSDVTFVDSSGLRVLVGAHAELEARGTCRQRQRHQRDLSRGISWPRCRPVEFARGEKSTARPCALPTQGGGSCAY